MAHAHLTFFFDFASPYAYFAFDEVLSTASETGVGIILRPAMVWSILKQQDIPAPLDTDARRNYLLADMERSAAFHGLPYRQPDVLPISAHKAARMWLGFDLQGNVTSIPLAQAIYAARFVHGLDIRDPAVLVAIAHDQGLDRTKAMDYIDAVNFRTALEKNVADAVDLGLPGLPCTILESETFFGADRISHLRWRLGLPQTQPAPVTSGLAP